MTYLKMIELFDNNDNECFKFENIQKDRILSKRPDLNAFLLIDRLLPSDRDIVAAASHDEIWLDGRPDDLANAGATEEDVLDLIRCGVRYDSDNDSLAMFA